MIFPAAPSIVLDGYRTIFFGGRLSCLLHLTFLGSYGGHVPAVWLTGFFCVLYLAFRSIGFWIFLVLEPLGRSFTARPSRS